MYLGKDDHGEDAFVSFGGPGYSGSPWQWWYHVDRRGGSSHEEISATTGFSCRTYPDFFASEPVPPSPPASGCSSVTTDCFTFDNYCDLLKATNTLKDVRNYECRQDDYDALFTNKGAETAGINNLRELAMLLANSQAEIEYGTSKPNGLREGACYSSAYWESCSYGKETYTNHYCGRGFLQITGCSNYVGAQRYLDQTGKYPGLNIVADPGTLETNRAASWDTALWYWRACVRNDKSGAMPACPGIKGFGSRSGALLDQGYFGVSTW
ncbi:class VII chitinase [Chlorella sorokiniana]|uniref:Class VII chitinase n=1 Tax=Chlorella sorokiniana TaxID=3076 RepID=A0A2P6TDK2_CHLSO|nr:class VII chitinase [Chlorella sorokiniana]|eukprot:PRW20723.1 class VII chitinase [Chlorella sorokiniana]